MSMTSSMSGSSLFQGARQVPDGFWLKRAIYTGRDTRESSNTASVPPLKSNQKRGESYLVLRLVCVPVSWRLFPGVLNLWVLLASGLVFRFCLRVWCRRVVLALLRRLFPSTGVCFKEEATTQGTDPKTGFSDRPTTCRAGSRWWSGTRGDDPRTDPLTGTIPTIYLAVKLATGIRITLYCLSFGSCGVTGTVCYGSGSFLLRSWRARMAPDGHHCHRRAQDRHLRFFDGQGQHHRSGWPPLRGHDGQLPSSRHALEEQSWNTPESGTANIYFRAGQD